MVFGETNIEVKNVGVQYSRGHIVDGELCMSVRNRNYSLALGAKLKVSGRGVSAEFSSCSSELPFESSLIKVD